MTSACGLAIHRESNHNDSRVRQSYTPKKKLSSAVRWRKNSIYTAIRIGAADMSGLLFAGARFVIAGAILLAWRCWRG
jgi:hypothetical protein